MSREVIIYIILFSLPTGDEQAKVYSIAPGRHWQLRITMNGAEAVIEGMQCDNRKYKDYVYGGC